MLKHLFYALLFLAPALNSAGVKISEPIILTKPIEKKPNLYEAMKLETFGLAHQVFELALQGHKKLAADGKLENPNILTIVDFSQSSRNKRMYVLDLESQTMVHHSLVAHGRNTGDEFAKNFSNIDGSWQSSLGFYVTRGTNMGASVGFSLIVEGLEKGFNDNAQRRQIIVHGAEYATENFIQRTGRLGRSFGCPAVPPENIRPIVNTIQNGTCLFIYFPDDTYLNSSNILNNPV